jgi:hypothetical protein
MAITSTPDSLNPIEKGVKWVATQAPTADPIETRFGYKLQVDGSDIYSTERSVLPLSGSDPIILDMKEDLLGQVTTKIPSPTLVGVENDSTGMIKEATLIHGTIVIDKSVDPPTVTKNVSNSSGPFKFINCGVNVFDSSDITAITPRLLSWIPDEVHIYPNTRLWVWFLGGTGVQYSWTYRNGSSGSTTGSSSGFDVGIIPLSPANIGISNADELVRIKATLVATGQTITVWVECNSPKVNTASIMWLEPIGGRSTIAFHEVSGIGMSSTYNLVKKHLDPSISFGTYQNKAGYSLAGKEGSGARTFAKYMKVTDKTMHWLEGFFGSSEYHIQHIDTNGSYVWNKFILTGGSFSIDPNSNIGVLSATGYLANQVISQKGHV